MFSKRLAQRLCRCCIWLDFIAQLRPHLQSVGTKTTQAFNLRISSLRCRVFVPSKACLTKFTNIMDQFFCDSVLRASSINSEFGEDLRPTAKILSSNDSGYSEGCHVIDTEPFSRRSNDSRHVKDRDPVERGKRFKCSQPSCSRTQGFITVHGLRKHLKRVHIVKVDRKTKSYKCASTKCIIPAKIWPRFDSFILHIIRMHADEDLVDLIARRVLFRPCVMRSIN